MSFEALGAFSPGYQNKKCSCRSLRRWRRRKSDAFSSDFAFLNDGITVPLFREIKLSILGEILIASPLRNKGVEDRRLPVFRASKLLRRKLRRKGS